MATRWAAWTLGLVVGCLGLVAAPASAGGSTWKFDADHYQPGDHAFAWASVSWEHSDTLGTPDDGPYFAYIARVPPGEFLDPGIPPVGTRVARIRISMEPYDAGGIKFGPHHATIDFTVPKLVEGVYSVSHCNSPCTTTLGDITFGRLAIGPATQLVSSASSSSSSSSIEHGRWSLISKADAGLSPSASFNALASNDDGLLLAGAQLAANAELQATIWQSPDGVRWIESTHPATSGIVFAVAVDGGNALAVGGTGLDGTSTFVWRSEDAGLTWTTAASGTSVFGKPALEMGRPNVSGLVRYKGWWVASGGRSDGYAAIWVSRDGTEWRQVLGSNPAGSATLVKGSDGSLLAYWSNLTWSTHDPTQWGEPQTASVPGRFYLSSVAQGATAAAGDNIDRHGQPTPLLHSNDGGLSWTKDKQFLARFPGATAWAIARVGDQWAVAGYSGNHADAWISADLRHWSALPEQLYGSPGGTLSLIGEANRRVVLFSTAPELNRYYAYVEKPSAK